MGFLKPWKHFVLERYNDIVEATGRGNKMYQREAIRTLKGEKCENILVNYYRIFSPHHGVTRNYVWLVYAIKQKRHHRNGSQEPRKYGQDCSACYVCGTPVGITEDFDGERIEIQWFLSPVMKDKNCSNIFNFRICCDECHHHSEYYDSLFDYAVSNGHTKRTSLAVRDEITTLTKAYMVYHHKYFRPE